MGQANNVAELHLDAVKNAKATLHLASADEHREKFALTNIESTKAQGTGKEFFLPGVHSDIGGGYRDDDKEKEQPIFSCNNRNEAEKELERLVDAGWYRLRDKDDKKEIFISPEFSSEALEYTELRVNRTGIKNHYSRIPLQIMAKEARKNGMVLKGQLDDNEEVPKELGKIQLHIENYIAGTTQSKAHDWDEKMNTDEALCTLSEARFSGRASG